jgi:branched-chain amino acid transport system permease protein
MLTLAVGELLSQLAVTWTNVTNGTNGLSPPKTTLYPGTTPLDQNLHTDRVYYYALIAFGVGYVFLRLLVASPFGRALVGIRENEARMRSLGYSVNLYKVAAFAVAGGVAGFAGAILIQKQRYVDYTIFSFTNYSALGVIALIIGGRATLIGPVLGGAFVYIMQNELSSYFSQHWMIVLGGIFIVVVYVLPSGFMGGATAAVRRLAATRASP